jgi:hypothetical protein
MKLYEKFNPEKPVIEQPKVSKTVVMNFASTIKDAGRNYRKEDGDRVPFIFIVIISGGEKREKDYFSKISDQNKFKQIKIEFIADPAKLNPLGLFETAKYKQEHYQTSQETEPDKIFIVSDVDHFYDELLKIKDDCTKADIYLIISNSCFEVWLYFGKFNGKPTDFVIPENNLEISQSFKAYLGKKVKGGVNPQKAIFDIKVAIQNAKKNYEEDSNGVPKLFSTNMFCLAESILPFIDADIEQMTFENIETKNKYKRERLEKIAERLAKQTTKKEAKELANILKEEYGIKYL